MNSFFKGKVEWVFWWALLLIRFFQVSFLKKNTLFSKKPRVDIYISLVFQPRKYFFGLLAWKKVIFQASSLDMHFHNILFKIDNSTFIVLPIIVLVFDLSMSFRKF